MDLMKKMNFKPPPRLPPVDLLGDTYQREARHNSKLAVSHFLKVGSQLDDELESGIEVEPKPDIRQSKLSQAEQRKQKKQKVKG
jgi:hypothetical protein